MHRIGSGLVRGDWDRIEKLILAMMVKHKVNVFIYLWDADGDCDRSEGCWDAASLLADAEAAALKGISSVSSPCEQGR